VTSDSCASRWLRPEESAACCASSIGTGHQHATTSSLYLFCPDRQQAYLAPPARFTLSAAASMTPQVDIPFEPHLIEFWGAGPNDVRSPANERTR
jgi:hypothetical protein